MRRPRVNSPNRSNRAQWRSQNERSPPIIDRLSSGHDPKTAPPYERRRTPRTWLDSRLNSRLNVQMHSRFRRPGCPSAKAPLRRRTAAIRGGWRSPSRRLDSSIARLPPRKPELQSRPVCLQYLSATYVARICPICRAHRAEHPNLPNPCGRRTMWAKRYRTGPAV